MQGWIKVHRKLVNNPIWQDPYYLKLWMYCLMKASHKEHKQLVGNQMVTLNPGEFVTGRKSLSDDLNNGVKPKQQLSERTWYRYLENLESWGMLTIKKTNKYSVVSINKWHDYQESDQQLTNNRPTVDHQLTTNKNVKNVKNKEYIVEIINYLNDVADKNYRYTTKKTQQHINARLEEGFTIDDFKKVVDIKTSEWKHDPKMNKYLRPETLFGNKFESYLNQNEPIENKSKGIDWDGL